MSGVTKVTALIAVAAAMLFAPGVVALPSAADFTPTCATPCTFTVDTTGLKITGGPAPGVNISGTNVGGVAVWNFGTVSIPSNATLNVSGNLPFKMVASGNMTVAGVLNGSGASAGEFVAGPNPGGPGGGFGGADVTQQGGGSGGGGVASGGNNGGGGGGFGGPGAGGGVCTNTAAPANCPSPAGIAGPGGTSYGDLNALFQGGSGGGGASPGGDSPVGGGGGGGAIGLFGDTITIPTTGQVRANGGNGNCGGQGASGGGSGGGILVHGDTVNVTGTLSAAGGLGGQGGFNGGDGGGGGGGRIAYQYVTLLASGTTNVSGGNSGAVQNCLSDFPSPTPTGGAGVVSKMQGVQATTGSASAITATTATLGAVINPESHLTTYHFDFGTSTAYGSQIPGSDAVIGSDANNDAASQPVTGLTPGTTYHFRVVATDSLGLVSRGQDVTFTTPVIPPPPPPPPPTATVASATSGPTATLTLSCAGVAGQVCAGSFADGAHEKMLKGSVVAVMASKKGKKGKGKKAKPKVVAITVASGSYSVPAGTSQTVTFTLNAVGRRLLSKFYSLPTTVTFSATQGNALPSRTVRFTYPRIVAPVAFNFFFNPTFTTVKQLSVTGAPRLGKVTENCRGGGCPFGTKVFAHKSQVNLAAPFGSAHLSPGTKITVEITAPNKVGSVAVFLIHGGAAPTEAHLCLPPGVSAPQKCAP